MRNERHILRLFIVVFICSGLSVELYAGILPKKEQELFTESVLNGLKWRCVGPANPGGRIDDLAVVESNPHIIYAATASGGVWKTLNNGVTWDPIFDDQNTSSIGDVTIAPSHPDIVWVGTGEPNNRNSSSWGDGVYKSTDGGKTWKNMGLSDTHHIGRIAVHPTDPDIVYVAALGHLWGPNRERGLFRTMDGGLTWVNTKFIDENTGFVDVVMDPENPSVLYAAAYQRRRRSFGFNGGGFGSGLYKTTNGGETWELLKNGLPSGIIGRIGIYIYRRNPNIVMATVEHKEGGVFRSEDQGITWEKKSSVNPRPMYYSKIRIDPNNDQKIWVLGGAMYISHDGGKTFKEETFRREPSMRRIHGDHHAMWINPSDSKHMIVGSDGGVYFTYDSGETWDFINTLPLGQIYEIGFDMRKPYFVYGALQDNDCWGGPSSTWYSLGITNDDWFRIGGGDGMSIKVDPTDYSIIYPVNQLGNIHRFDLKTGEKRPIRPEPDDEKETYRFNWKSPILISPHDPKTIYLGGNKLFISRDRGETWEASVDLTTRQDRDKLPLMGVLTGENTLSRNDGITFFGNITTISESPLRKGLLYVGTDDGNLQISQDGGKSWKNLIEKIPGVPKKTYISRIVASSFDEGAAYVTFDGHRDDDFKAYVFKTTDHGQSWVSISSNLPDGGTVNVIREHHRNPDLLFVGTERGAYLSIDRGRKWVKMKSNLPIVPVDDIAIHPRENDLIFGTHGRSIWILDDITPLEQLTEKILALQSYLFKIHEAILFIPFDHKSTIGHRVFVAPNKPNGAVISYYLKDTSKDEVTLIIKDKDGKKIRELKGPGESGINRTTWDLRYSDPPQSTMGEFARQFRTQAPRVLPGEYTVVLKVSNQEMSDIVRVISDPRVKISFEERKAQHDALYTLYKIYPLLHTTCKTSEDMQSQVSAVKRALEELPGVPLSLKEAAEDIFKKTNDIRFELLGNPKLGWPGVTVSVRANLILTGRSLGGYTGAPSEKQLQKIRKNSERLKNLAERINTLIEEDVSRLNAMMIQSGLSQQISVEKIRILD